MASSSSSTNMNHEIGPSDARVDDNKDDDDNDLVVPTAESETMTIWAREMASFEKLITTQRKLLETVVPKNITRQNTNEIESASQKLKEVNTEIERGIFDLRKIKKLVLHQSNDDIQENYVYGMPKEFQKSSFFKEYEALYHELRTDELKQCLLSLAVFPQNAKVKRRVSVQWWMGEGFIPPRRRSDDTTRDDDLNPAEWWGDLYFDELISRGFLEPVNKRHSPSVNTCTMRPFVRTVVVKLASDADFFGFNVVEGNVTEDYSSSLRSCLNLGKKLTNVRDLDKLQTLFNVDETLLLLNPDWVSKMKNARVLHLGSWQATANYQIEVFTMKSLNNIKYLDALDGLEKVTRLRLLNLERFSRIRKLPHSISKLTNLTILNIRACHNLEFLPKEIGSFENLTHLDMSECYLLEHMPKEIAKLKKIQVLKGFVVRHTDISKPTCTLWDLRECIELRQLALHIRMDNFPSGNDLRSLHTLKALTKLAITWGSPLGQGSAPESKKGRSLISRALCRTKTLGRLRDIDTELPPKLSLHRFTRSDATLSHSILVPLTEIEPELPPQLKKLKLVCLPFTFPPIWLKAFKLINLRKLCFKGGNLSYLARNKDFIGYNNDDMWNVEELHLKYMNDLEMEWSELHEQFPVLKYLIKVNCPRMPFFPCDGDGVWIG